MSGASGTLPQPYEYRQRELREPDWTRLPGWADITTAEWEDAQWQRAHCVKNLKQLRAVMGDLLTDDFYEDLELDQAERATMSMLIPPQMMNTMVPDSHDEGTPTTAEFTEAFYTDPVRRYMLPVFSDRRSDWPSHPYASRDSLHEHDMWKAEGLTHRYPTKVLAEMLSTCPQYCGHCTRMDLVGNSTAQISKMKLSLKPVDRMQAHLDYLRATPSVRDVVVSGGDVGNMPWKNLELYVDQLLDIENIRDIRLATKALMGLPQHWYSADVLAGAERLATKASSRGVGLAVHTHVNHANSVTPLVARASRGPAGRRCPRHPQPGRADGRHQRLGRTDARPVLRPARRRQHPAVLLLHARHDPVRRALAGAALGRSAAADPGDGLPPGVRHTPSDL